MEIPEITEKTQPDNNLKEETTKAKRNKGIKNIDKVPEVVNPENIDLTNPHDEEIEEKKKSGSKKGSKGSKGSKTKDNVKPKANKEPEKPTEDDKELRSRTINPPEPSTSKTDDECEILEAKELCAKFVVKYSKITIRSKQINYSARS